MWIIGCDFHPRYQQIASLNKATGEIVERRLSHEQREAEAYYEGLPRGALVGMEATCAARWFERLLDRCGQRRGNSSVISNDPGEVRRRARLVNLLVSLDTADAFIDALSGAEGSERGESRDPPRKSMG